MTTEKDGREAALVRLLGDVIGLALAAGLGVLATGYGFWRLYAVAWAAALVLHVGTKAAPP